jgi:AcrR family transcriptional regulator
VSIDDVARAAGISKGLLYHYFPTKRDFYVATVREAAQQMLAIVYPDKALPPIERLARGIELYLDYVDAHRVAYAALLRSGVGADPEVARILDHTRGEFMRRILEGLPVEKPPAKVRTTLRGFIGFVEAASLDWVEHRDISRDELRDLLIDFLAGALQRVVSS